MAVVAGVVHRACRSDAFDRECVAGSYLANPAVLAICIVGDRALAAAVAPEGRQKIMRPLFLALTLTIFSALAGVASAKADDAGMALEKEVSAIVAGPQVTVVHLWAPWCGNCKAEMRPDGWAKFVVENPSVKIVFINVWNRGQEGAPKLAAAGLGTQKNFTALTHPNSSSKGGERLEKFLEIPISWIPTTWVFRDGQLRYALNYGEVRFEMLQQMVKDAGAEW